jgi:hypothetical protein
MKEARMPLGAIRKTAPGFILEVGAAITSTNWYMSGRHFEFVDITRDPALVQCTSKEVSQVGLSAEFESVASAWDSMTENDTKVRKFRGMNPARPK